MNPKRVLAAVFSMGLERKRVTADALAESLGLTRAEAESQAKHLAEKGLLKAGAGGLSLTARGRRSIKVVFIGGGFEIIHYGHVHTISKAKELGDALVVSVARDATIRRRKRREPIVGEKDRVKLLSALRQVDAAILGVKGDIYVTLRRVSPDIVALGYDQYHLEDEIRSEARKRGLKVRVVRLDAPYPGIKTSRLLKEL
ncbi:MAG TPA: adenylyltransferase/cytidyltransferase family protein [Nitrososphaerales archaeon]|nr:adenylyltransferase/cytidyltransferase family protein [Nitrososphaerales archaeon]